MFCPLDSYTRFNQSYSPDSIWRKAEIYSVDPQTEPHLMWIIQQVVKSYGAGGGGLDEDEGGFVDGLWTKGCGGGGER